MKRAVLVVCDGLRADTINPELTPNLARFAGVSHIFANHRGVFPSTTRVTSASIATGCLPGNHGLEGNVVVLDEGDGLVAVSAGPPDFRDRLQRARGRTLLVPTLAQRLEAHGGSIVFSNVSAGAAQFQDPDGYGYVYHRQGSYGPGRQPLSGSDHLDVTHDTAGDAAMTERFLDEVLRRRAPALAVLWQCEPDHTQHTWPLGSPEHLAAVAGADSCAASVVEAVEALEAAGDDILLILCSDHGHETVDRVIPLETLLIEAGLKAAVGSTDVVVASNGTSASIYLSDAARPRAGGIVEFLRSQEWIGDVFAGSDLAALGHRTDTPLAIAVTTRNLDTTNPYGVAGMSHTIADPLSGESHIGCGQHGGLGRHEQHPFLLVRGGGFGGGKRVDAPSSPVDIAPTILRHLGLPHDGMDGAPLAID